LFTEEGDVVLDPFIGSGTTAVACINNGRHYVGIEAMQHYYDLAQENIERAKNGNGGTGEIDKQRSPSLL
jgi:DNA modification methylase